MPRSLLIYKAKALLLFNVAYAFFYLYPNFSPLSAPHYLPLTRLDLVIPFLPWTFLIYLSDYLLVYSVLFLLKEKAEVDSIFRTSFTGLLLCGIVFLFYPTTYPRPIEPVTSNAIVRFCMWVVWSFDTPNNCFPSMHVAMTGIATWMLRNENRRRFFAYCIWAVAIFVSTLTTKQHYLFDIFGGLGVISIAVLVEEKIFRRIFSLNQ